MQDSFELNRQAAMTTEKPNAEPGPAQAGEDVSVKAVARARAPVLASLETPTLTKADLASLLFDHLGLNKRESKDMVEAFFGIVHSALSQGQDVKISGFGNFTIRRKASRPGRNPRTGEAIPIKARHVVTFHASHKLKAIVQGEAPGPEDFE
jgi:integration host factor subunit alpha